jgi:hypothetical protein
MTSKNITLVQGKIVKYYFWLIYFLSWPLYISIFFSGLYMFDITKPAMLMFTIFAFIPGCFFFFWLCYIAPKYQLSIITLKDKTITLKYNYGYFEKNKEFDLGDPSISFHSPERTSLVDSGFFIKENEQEHKFELLEALELNKKFAEYDFYSDSELTIAQKLCKIFELIQSGDFKDTYEK